MHEGTLCANRSIPGHRPKWDATQNREDILARKLLNEHARSHNNKYACQDFHHAFEVFQRRYEITHQEVGATGIKDKSTTVNQGASIATPKDHIHYCIRNAIQQEYRVYRSPRRLFIRRVLRLQLSNPGPPYDDEDPGHHEVYAPEHNLLIKRNQNGRHNHWHDHIASRQTKQRYACGDN